MPRYGQLVMGPAGSGKSTYCSTLVKHCETIGRTVYVINLDPAAEHFDYPVTADIRELVSVDEVMDDEELKFGPNGGLIFCMEYLVQNFDWLFEQLEDNEDDYFIFDCPGQIELYTHVPVMRQLVDQLHHWNFRVAGVFLIDSQFMVEASKFISGILSALSAMVNLEIPHVNVMTKIDLLSNEEKKDMERFLEPNFHYLLEEEFEMKSSKKFKKLNEAMSSVIDDFSLVHFLPLDQSDEESVNDILIHIDNAIQFGEDLETKTVDKFEQDDDEDS